jgi:type VI protein secretion system component Hcp
MSDPIEDRVDQALKAAAKAASYDGPEFMALRQAVEDLKLDLPGSGEVVQESLVHHGLSLTKPQDLAFPALAKALSL